METFAEDAATIIALTGLQDFKLSALNVSPTRSQNRTRKYFSELPFHLRKRLYDFYAIDFEMFGYSAEEFL